MSGNANPYISIKTVERDGKIKAGKYGLVQCTVGNAGNGSIAPESLELTISCANNSRFTGLKNIGDGWEVKSISKEKTGNTIKLINNFWFYSFVLVNLFIRYRAVKPGPASTVTANIAYRLGINKQTGKQHAADGNASPADDNSLTSITVIK